MDRKNKEELYFSVDIETDGPIPIEYSMLSFGCAVFNKEGDLLDTFEANLETLEGAKQHMDTMSWWQLRPHAWEKCRENLKSPKGAMIEFTKWVRYVSNKYNAIPIFVSYPSGFDFTFIYTYLVKFVGYSIFSFSALDIKTYAMAVINTSFKKSAKRYFPKRWKSKKRHTHIALDDAIEQGELFINILKENATLEREQY